MDKTEEQKKMDLVMGELNAIQEKYNVDITVEAHILIKSRIQNEENKTPNEVKVDTNDGETAKEE